MAPTSRILGTRRRRDWEKGGNDIFILQVGLMTNALAMPDTAACKYATGNYVLERVAACCPSYIDVSVKTAAVKVPRKVAVTEITFAEPGSLTET